VPIDGRQKRISERRSASRALVVMTGLAFSAVGMVGCPSPAAAAPHSGIVFIADSTNNQILEQRPGEPATVFQSGLSDPEGVALDASGNVYIADTGLNEIIKETPAHKQSVLGFFLEFPKPTAVAVDEAGDVFVADSFHKGVGELRGGVGAPIIIGSGVGVPDGVAVDAFGDVFIADPSNNRVVEVEPNGQGQRTVVSGFPPAGIALDSAGNLYAADPTDNRIVKQSPRTGSASSTIGSGFSHPTAVAVKPGGATIVADTGGDRIEKVAAGNGAQTTLASDLGSPSGVAVYAPPPQISANIPSRVPAGIGVSITYTATNPAAAPPARFRLVAGQLPPGLSFDPSTAAMAGTPITGGTYHFTVSAYNAAAQSLLPATMVVTAANTVLVADTGNDRVLELPRGGPTTTIRSGSPYDMTADAAGNLYYDETGAFEEIVKVATDGKVTTLGDSANLDIPEGIAVDARGDLYVADTFNNRVVELPAGGEPATTVGTGLSFPADVALDPTGHIYIADTGNDRIVKLSPSGNGQTTVAGGLNSPSGLVVDASGDIFVSDSASGRVVELPVAGGTQTTVASGLGFPTGVGIDAAGNVIVADSANNRVVRVPVGGGPATTIAAGLRGPNGVFVIVPPPTLTADTPPTAAAAGTPFSYTYQATASYGEPPLTFRMDAGGHLPPGLKLNRTTGELSGTPTTTGSYTFTVRAQNAATATLAPPATITVS
jgi:sugar lactone lactonase YvrE